MIDINLYGEMQRELRSISNNLIRQSPKRYGCLTTSHHDKISQNFRDQKFRFGILPRRNVESRNREHSFDCGKTRIELFLGGTFESGIFTPNANVPYRWVFCPMVSTDFFIEEVYREFEEYWPKAKYFLHSRDYLSFVSGCLDIVQDNLEVLKWAVLEENTEFE